MAEISSIRVSRVSNKTSISSLLRQAHAESLFHLWSLNAKDARERHHNFTLHGFARGGALISLGVLAATFLTQQTVFSIFQSLRRPSLKHWRRVLMISFGVIFVACISVALIGYFSFEYQSRGFIFSTMIPRYVGLDSPDYATNVARALLLLTISLTYPMQLFFGRINAILLAEAIFGRFKLGNDNVVFYGVTIVMWTTSILVGALVDDIFYVFAMVGAMFAAPMIYVMPILSYFGLQGGIMFTIRQGWTRGDCCLVCKSVIGPLLVLGTGILITIFSPIITTTQKFGLTKF